MASLKLSRRCLEHIARVERAREDEVERKQAERLKKIDEVAEKIERRIHASLASTSEPQNYFFKS